MPRILPITAPKAPTFEPISQNLLLWKFEENSYVSNGSYL